jgi:hypothetical protein
MAASSVFNKLSRYVHGGDTEVGEIGLEWWDRRSIPTDPSDSIFIVTAFHAKRLDLIASAFYNEPRYWWVIAQVNNILDPQTEVYEGRKLAIPSADRLMIILNGNTGGYTSTREKNVNIISPVIV